MCQLRAIGICARETGRSMRATGTTTSRPPSALRDVWAPSPDRGTIPYAALRMHYAHEALGAVWLDMGEWKRPRFYRRPSPRTSGARVEAGVPGRPRARGSHRRQHARQARRARRDAGTLLDKVYTNRFSDLRPGRVRYR